jgi:hypothetical protein
MDLMTGKEFQVAMRELPVPDAPPEPHLWPRHCYEIHGHAERDNPLLTWSTLHATMFVGEAPWIEQEYRFLRNDGWQRWRPATREDDFGDPPRLSYDKGTSGNLIHQAYHLALWEDVTGKRIEHLKRIVEFGGGYGAMCKIVRRLGFEGDYVIYDLPELSLIQRYYLSNLSIQADLFLTDGLTDIEPIPPGDLMIGLYSLTEAPIALRNTFTSSPFPACLIAHQDVYASEDLTKWSDWFMNLRDDLNWKVIENDHLLGHRYVIGWQDDR